MIDLDGVAATFGTFALGPLALHIERGVYTVVLGPSGAGKSLLLHLVAGLAQPCAGRILLDGRDVTASTPEARRAGLVFQHPALFPHLGVRENLAYGPRVQRLAAAEREARVEAVVASLRLGPLLGRPVAGLSGGEMQRVALGRALAIHPTVLLLDEPLGPLDHNTRLELQRELRRVHDELGLTTLHVTHSRSEARALADRCVVLHAGRIIQEGDAADVFARPRCPFVAEFLGVKAATPGPGCDESCRSGRCSLTAPARL